MTLDELRKEASKQGYHLVENDDRWKITFKDRELSFLILSIFHAHNISDREEMAKALGVSLPYFNNKLQRNSFSFDDICRACDASGCSIIIGNVIERSIGKTVVGNNSITICPKEFMKEEKDE